ncbi:RNA ligase protein [Halorhabdus tiamatea SARL4B]|uniref:RNA ligase protein n=1 Tax=Halorhabdus tiamatea SARL4B TaxID=1033806 RepID=F7PMP6_9EURY|nr:RNA ligase family protein [Halorhabdus tiamatea]ERJ07454.1 RNA ligase protein [Halorhabdus tiamatea SARL4B]
MTTPTQQAEAELARSNFRQRVFDRDRNQCLVPWCDDGADDAHHIIERDCWDHGGYIESNGASVCNKHHQAAERTEIPPQAFWLWISLRQSGVDPKTIATWDAASADKPLPNRIDTVHVDKWGDHFDTPPHDDLREHIKYPSTRHLLPLYWNETRGYAEERITADDSEVDSLDAFVGVPLVITEKIDGGNCLLVSDLETPVRARNGRKPTETMKPLYRDGGLYWEQEVSRKLPDRFQVFGEWVYARHSIHYGCDCSEPCDDVGPSLSELTGVDDDRAYFQVFGVFDTRLNLWLSWPTVDHVADQLGFPTTPVIYEEDHRDQPTFETVHEAREQLLEYAHAVVDRGGEGIVVRPKYPFHYGQFTDVVGKYVRPNHVTTDEHWSKGETVVNIV